MAIWSNDELHKKSAETDDLHISPFHEDGVTYGTPTWIWSVVVDDALYVRAYNGQNSCWYKSAMRQKAGRTRIVSRYGAGKLDASAVLDLTVDLDSVPRGYDAMDHREAIKVMVRP